jgi:hypothetical protein
MTTSRRLQRRSRPSAGGSDATDPSLTRRIARTLTKTRRGGLPPSRSDTVWTGRSEGRAPCSGCGEDIALREYEYEVEGGDTVVLRFHAVCFRAWYELQQPVRKRAG